jgi:hypothetical protein
VSIRASAASARLHWEQALGWLKQMVPCPSCRVGAGTPCVKQGLGFKRFCDDRDRAAWRVYAALGCDGCGVAPIAAEVVDETVSFRNGLQAGWCEASAGIAAHGHVLCASCGVTAARTDYCLTVCLWTPEARVAWRAEGA